MKVKPNFNIGANWQENLKYHPTSVSYGRTRLAVVERVSIIYSQKYLPKKYCPTYHKPTQNHYFPIVIATLSLVCFLWRIHLKNSDTTTNLMTRITVEMMATVRCLATVVLVTQDKRLLKQGSHFSEVTKFQYFSRISQVFRSKFPGMCLIFFHFQVVLKQKPANL